MFNKIVPRLDKLLVLFLVALVTSQALIVAAYGQDGDLESRKIKYKELMIAVGDDVYSSLKEDKIVKVIISSPHSSPATVELARKFQDELLWNRVWFVANSLTPALYWGGFWLVGNTAPKIIGDNLWLVGVGVGLSILSGASFSLAGLFHTELPVTLVESYNEDLRKALNLTLEAVYRL